MILFHLITVERAKFIAHLCNGFPNPGILHGDSGGGRFVAKLLPKVSAAAPAGPLAVGIQRLRSVFSFFLFFR